MSFINHCTATDKIPTKESPGITPYKTIGKIVDSHEQTRHDHADPGHTEDC